MSRRDSPRGHKSSPPNGRICCAQPIGDSHASQALVTRVPAGSTVPSMLPTPLSTNVTPRVARADPGRAAAGGGQLDGDRGDADEHQADRPDRCADQHRPGRRLPVRQRPPRPVLRPGPGRRLRRCDGRGQAGVPAHHRGAEQLGAAELLVLPGVPHHREGAHQRGEHGQRDVLAVQHVAADGGPGGEPEEAHAGVGCHHLGLTTTSSVQARLRENIAVVAPTKRPPCPPPSEGVDGRGARPGESSVGCR